VCAHSLEDTVDFRANAGEIDGDTFTHDTFLPQSDNGTYECGSGRHIDMLQG